MKVILENRLAAGSIGTVKGKVRGYLQDSMNNQWVIVDVRDMKDGRGNDLKLYQKKMDQVILGLKKKKVIVCCKHGRSRSMAIAMGVLVKHFGLSQRDALETVNQAGARIHPSHLEALRIILDKKDRD
jgi:protein-tyrosine phosphatase